MRGAETKKKLLPGQREELLGALRARFEKNMNRHKGLEWPKVKARLEARAEKLWSLSEMERTGGEPDVVAHDKKTDEYIFFDCSAESPSGRRSVCYDREGQESRKEHKPENNAIDMAAAMGIELLTEEQYRELQKLGNFDTKTSSWVKAPSAIRKLGGALFGDRRFGQVFVYHNGAQSYYSARAFRGSLRVKLDFEFFSVGFRAFGSARISKPVRTGRPLIVDCQNISNSFRREALVRSSGSTTTHHGKPESQ